MRREIYRRVAALEHILKPGRQVVTIELSNGTLEEKNAAEWWEHRHEWPLANFDNQDNSGGLVVLLMLARMADDGATEARENGNTSEAERYEQERDNMLTLYFGEKE